MRCVPICLKDCVCRQAVLVLRSDPVFPLVFVWAAVSIRTYHQGDETVRTAAGLAALVVLMADVGFVLHRKLRGNETEETSPFLSYK
jgi:hypothetical protein